MRGVVVIEKFKIDKPIRLIELFAGYGSQAMALKRIGAEFEHYRVVENDKYAIKSYNAVHGTDFPVTDIRDLHGEDLGIVDTDKYIYLLTYSFPCTDISIAGNQEGFSKGSGTRSSLLWEVERLLTELDELPQVLMMENVKQIVSKKNKPNFDIWCEFLESLGYSNCWDILNAKDYGVPQNRERCFLFSFWGDYTYQFPKPITLTKCIKDILEDKVDEKYYINTERARLLIEKLISNGELTGGVHNYLTDQLTILK